MDHIFWCIGHTLLNEKIVKADNEFLFDLDGNRYLDLVSGVWCTSLGHNHPAVAAAIGKRLNSIIHTGFCYVDPIIETAAVKILGILEMTDGKAVFLTSGSEAVEFGVRVAQAICEKPYLLMLSDSYFGAYGSASKKSPEEWVFFDWLSCRSCANFESCNPDCPKISALPFEKIGGMLFEPGSSSGAVRFIPKSILGNLVRKIRENDGFVIVNEITTGIGRTGRWFGFQHYGFAPDIVAMGKGLGNGYPVSVTAMNRRVVERIERIRFIYSQSHQCDPLGAEVALAVLRTIEEEKLVERSQKMGSSILQRLQEIKEKSGAIKEIRGRGMMFAIEFENDPSGRSVAERLYRELYARKIIVSLRSAYEALRLDPCLTIHKESVETFLDTFEELLA
jgi:acetylornithine aminotransferase